MPLGSVITTTSTTKHDRPRRRLPPEIPGKTLEIKDPRPDDPSRRQVVIIGEGARVERPTRAGNGGRQRRISHHHHDRCNAVPAELHHAGAVEAPRKHGSSVRRQRGAERAGQARPALEDGEGNVRAQGELRLKLGTGPSRACRSCRRTRAPARACRPRINGGTKYCVAFGGAAGGQGHGQGRHVVQGAGPDGADLPSARLISFVTFQPPKSSLADAVPIRTAAAAMGRRPDRRTQHDDHNGNGNRAAAGSPCP